MLASSKSRSTAVLAALVLAWSALSACGGSDSKPADNQSQAAQPTPDPQTAFLSGVVARHAAAIDLLDLTGDRPISDKLKGYVDEVRQERSGQVLVIGSQVQQRGFDLPPLDNSAEGEGLISQVQLDRLAALGDAEFDGMWLEEMIGLDRGTIAYVNATAAAKDDPETAKTARELKVAMRTEIAKWQAFKG